MAKHAKNTLYTNDNLYVLSGLNSEIVDLIYLDPPFNKNQMFSAPIGSKAAGASFKDMWTWNDVDEYYLDSLADNFPSLARYIASVGEVHSKPMMAYLTYMAQRVVEMHRVLKDTGSLYLHCDPTASHYLKHLLDSVFGKNNFRNEITWFYRRWSAESTRFQRMHDIILFYGKSRKNTFNRLSIEPTEGQKTKHQRGYDRNSVLIDGKRQSQLIVYDQQKVDAAIQAGKLSLKDFTRTITVEKTGTTMPDVWEIPILNSQAKERTGHPTQKPLALLNRIILASSNEGDLVMDPFCGCATTCVAAQQLGRRWIGIDLGLSVVDLLVQRLSNTPGRLFRDFIATQQVPKRTDVQVVQPTESVKQKLYKEQNGRCNACGEDFQVRNLEVDHIIPKSKGGGDYYENYQLLCGNCNRIKGDRPMEYLRLKIETRERMMKHKIVFGE
ncbi:MAG: HNH endonuclease [Planctomycetaceae bacterium]|nr:HNH endonuclease [Planctomycetaceae bacterium]